MLSGGSVLRAYGFRPLCQSRLRMKPNPIKYCAASVEKASDGVNRRMFVNARAGAGS